MKRTKDIITLRTELTTDNWQEQLTRLALDAAVASASELGVDKCVELAVATLQTYYLHTYARSIPFVEDTSGTAPARLKTLRHILESCGISPEVTSGIIESTKDEGRRTK